VVSPNWPEMEGRLEVGCGFVRESAHPEHRAPGSKACEWTVGVCPCGRAIRFEGTAGASPTIVGSIQHHRVSIACGLRSHACLVESEDGPELGEVEELVLTPATVPHIDASQRTFPLVRGLSFGLSRISANFQKRGCGAQGNPDTNTIIPVQTKYSSDRVKLVE
jgi:hypothetical protein